MEGHRMLAEFGWHEYEYGVSQMSSYTLRQMPCHFWLAGQFVHLYAMLHDVDYLAELDDEPLGCWKEWPQEILNWGALNQRSVAYGSYSQPGWWFEITDFYERNWTDWRCTRCGEGGCTGRGELGINNVRCPACGWEGNKSDHDVWLKAKAEFDEKHRSAKDTQ